MSARGVVTDGHEPDEQERISQRVRLIAEHRSVIDQAKGMLMFVYGMSADDAFGVLRQQSQDHNVKVSVLAGQIVTALLEERASCSSANGLDSPGVLLAAHQRLTALAARNRTGPSMS
jgi:hypothetical protein